MFFMEPGADHVKPEQKGNGGNALNKVDDLHHEIRTE
jgi:hypothetical protein